jgi:hypothetical protein
MPVQAFCMEDVPHGVVLGILVRAGAWSVKEGQLDLCWDDDWSSDEDEEHKVPVYSAVSTGRLARCVALRALLVGPP